MDSKVAISAQLSAAIAIVFVTLVVVLDAIPLYTMVDA